MGELSSLPKRFIESPAVSRSNSRNMYKQQTYTFASGRSVVLDSEESLDKDFTLLDLREEVSRYHAVSFAGKEFLTPKELAAWISVHAGKLQALFLTMTSKKSVEEVEQDAFLRMEVEAQIADILAFVLLFANVSQVSLANPLFQILEHHRQAHESVA